jgi:hypothetical protein
MNNIYLMSAILQQVLEFSAVFRVLDVLKKSSHFVLARLWVQVPVGKIDYAHFTRQRIIACC